MAIELSIAESRKYIICRVTEPITATFAREMAVQIQKFAEDAGIHSRLVDVRESQNVSSVAKNYDLAYRDLDGLQVARASRAAVLVSPHDSSHDFAMTVIRNAGFNVRKFNDEAAAIAWLEKD